MHSTDPTPSVTVAFLDLQKNYEEIGAEVITIPHTDWQMHYVVIDLKPEHVGHSIRPYLYIGRDPGIYYFDEFEYKEIEIEDGMAWLQRAPERIRRRRPEGGRRHADVVGLAALGLLLGDPPRRRP